MKKKQLKTVNDDYVHIDEKSVLNSSSEKNGTYRGNSNIFWYGRQGAFGEE